MRSFSTVDLLRDLKTVTHAASRSPVTITQHRKPRFVLMAVEDYERLRNPDPDPRKVYRTKDTPPELREMFLEALDRIADGEDAPNDG
ncbi:MAG TPA: type II toxin-antitoxin system prevent-host-death family antitoxin [Rhizomicrobium sp.]|jgi:prevent-host-death family protein